MPVLFTPTNFAPYPWMEYAFLALGYEIHEDHDPNQRRIQNNPYIVDFLRFAHVSNHHLQDETYWCAAFVNWCIHNAGLPITGTPSARQWRNWGQSLGAPTFGCVTVFVRQGGGHVGFYVGPGRRSGHIAILGGNQADRISGGAVNIRDYPLSRLLAYRWPQNLPIPS